MSRLRQELLDANRDILRLGLAVLTWGNVSARVDTSNILIKPSGVPYENMRMQDMVEVDMQGRVPERALRPSCDTPTHLAIYRAFSQVQAICHVHSSFATAFAQAGIPISPLGTTQADSFAGCVPVTRQLSPEETAHNYELNIGKVIVETFAETDVLRIPGVLVRQHGVFTWGDSPKAAVQNAFILEQIAMMNFRTLFLNPTVSPLPDYILRKHNDRKHGSGSYYGQRTRSTASSGDRSMCNV